MLQFSLIHLRKSIWLLKFSFNLQVPPPPFHADCVIMVLFTMFLCPLYFLLIGDWVLRLDRLRFSLFGEIASGIWYVYVRHIKSGCIFFFFFGDFQQPVMLDTYISLFIGSCKMMMFSVYCLFFIYWLECFYKETLSFIYYYICSYPVSQFIQQRQDKCLILSYIYQFLV